MSTHVVRVKRKGQITLPADLRRKYHLDEGSQVVIEDRDGVLILSRTEDVVDPTAGIFRDYAYTRNPDVNEEKAWTRRHIAEPSDSYEE